jgi:tetratricopeptide (TPR) repeat protein
MCCDTGQDLIFRVDPWPFFVAWWSLRLRIKSAILRRLVCTATLSVLSFLPVSSSLAVPPQIPTSTYDEATSAFQQGKLQEAETTLRLALRKHPSDSRALGLLGVILDAQNRFEEAERCYRRALAQAPTSAALHNNLGNHYLARGLPDRARAAFQRVVWIDPYHPNANLQLAQLSVQQKDGQAALRFLGRLPAAEHMTPAVQLLRAQALHQTGKKVDAEALLSELEKQASSDARLAFSIGMAFVNWERFEEAERAFSRALEATPTNFDVLYNLGLAATRAGHLERAEQVFEAALRQRPDDVDCLAGLARVHLQQGKDDQAAACLVRAQRLAPERPELLLLLAHTSEKLGFYGDTALAFEQYLKLRPNEHFARRERGFALARSGKRKEGLQDLEWYVQKYPNDADGLYKLGIAEAANDRDKALADLTLALGKDPKFLPARYARATLHYQAGRAAEAIEDVKPILKQTPNDVPALDLLGQCHLLLEQPAEAAKVLSRAVELAPRDSRALLHYAQALRRLNRKGEADAMLMRFKQAGPDQAQLRARSGLFDYLNLSPAEQRTQSLASLQRSVAASPDDFKLKIRLGKALLATGQRDEALQLFRTVAELTSDGQVLAACGKALMEYDEYGAAQRYLETAVDSDHREARLDLALAVSRTAGPQPALAVLENVPADQRGGDYYLLRAQVLDLLGSVNEAAEALNRGFRAAPTRADLYFQAALFLIKHRQYTEAQQLLQQANSLVPDVPELMLTRAIVFELMKEPAKAKQLLLQMQSRWPEWEMPYLIHGIVLQTRLFSAEAKAMLETAIALGAKDPAAYYYLALATQHATPDDTEGVLKAISQAVQRSPEDPFIRSLAGRNALARKDHIVAIEHLKVALRNRPDLVEAQYALSAAYRGTGNHEQAAVELAKAQQLEKEVKSDDLGTSPVRDLLFTVRPPGRDPVP